MQQGLGLLKQSLATGQVVDRPDALVSFEELNRIMGMEQVQDLEERFLTPAQKQAKYRGADTAPVPGVKHG
jgi:hypothetical protein